MLALAVVILFCTLALYLLQVLPIFLLFSSQVPDEAVSKCTGCGTDFGAFVRKVNSIQMVREPLLCLRILSC